MSLIGCGRDTANSEYRHARLEIEVVGSTYRAQTPAMAAGVTNTLWSLTDMVRVIEDWEAERAMTPGNRLVG